MARSSSTTIGCVISLIVILAVIAFGQETTPAGTAIITDATPQVPQHKSTLENLQTTFFAENDESALFAQYAIKADQEGYRGLASLFRAIARGEGIHAANCAALIRQMGQTPKMIDEPLIVLSSTENLASADATQIYEKDVMYPEFVTQALQEKNKAAAGVFNHNMAAEPSHDTLIQQAQKDLERYRGERITFLVCPTCGYAVRSLKTSACPVCSTPKDQFVQVN